MSTPDTSTLGDNAPEPRSPLGHSEPDPRRWQALAVVCIAFFMTVLDGTIVTVALPSITHTKTLLASGDSAAAAARAGFALGFWVLAGIGAVSVVSCIVLVRGRELEQTATTLSFER